MHARIQTTLSARICGEKPLLFSGLIINSKSKTKKDMKTTDNNQNKKFTELSDEELEKVNGGLAMPAGRCDLHKCPELGKKTNPRTCECE